MRMEAEVKGDATIAAAAEKMFQTEMDIWSRCDLVLYPSQEEIDVVHALAPRVRAAFVPPFQFDSFVTRDRPNPGHKLLFVAGFRHSPNVDAATWLVKDVMPAVWQECPQAVLYLVGSNPTDEVKVLAQAGRVVVTGGVSEQALAEHYADARVSVVPLRFGAGVKLKVLETMQSGIPLVTTSVGLQGLPEVSAVLEPRDTPQRLAADLLLLLQSDETWQARSAAQTRYVREHFSTTCMRQRFQELLDQPRAPRSVVGLRDAGGALPEGGRMRIIDGFTFYNEVDMLELRLRYLAPHVDEFLIVEADHKFSGEPKPLLLQELMLSERFAWIADRVHIRSLQVDTSAMKFERPEAFDPSTDFWKIEAAQRDAIRPQDLQPGDFLLMGDVDEIPDAAVLQRLRHDTGFRDWARLEPRICRQLFSITTRAA
jgi:hypothetical protein